MGDVGEIYKVRVTNALDRPWAIRELILLDISTKDKLIFDFSKFIGLKDGECRVDSGKILLEICHNFYNISVEILFGQEIHVHVGNKFLSKH